jgi:hypothetical protein
MDHKKIFHELLTPSEEGKRLLRLVASGYLGGLGVLAVLIPGLLLGFLGAGFFPQTVVTDIFQAWGILAGALAYTYYISHTWNDTKAKQDMMLVVGATFCLLGVWDLLVLFWGYEIGFLIILNLPINAAFAFLHAVQLQFVKLPAKVHSQ